MGVFKMLSHSQLAKNLKFAGLTLKESQVLWWALLGNDLVFSSVMNDQVILDLLSVLLQLRRLSIIRAD